MQRAGPPPVLSGEGRELPGLVAILSRPTGVGGRECKTIGYTCRTGALTIFGQGFNSPRLHHTTLRATRRLIRRSLSSWSPPDKPPPVGFVLDTSYDPPASLVFGEGHQTGILFLGVDPAPTHVNGGEDRQLLFLSNTCSGRKIRDAMSPCTVFQRISRLMSK